jgi:Flp pilus assembly protein CpaB
VQTTSTLSVQTTMQNVEVLAVGQEATAPSNSVSPLAGGRQPGNVITFLVDHQDALVLKFIKDSGGVIDLALRSPDDSQAVQTDAVTLSTIYDQFKFRLAGPLRP